MKRKTWDIVRWDDRPEDVVVFPDFPCWKCGHEADIPRARKGPTIIAVLQGGGLVFDNPVEKPAENFMPQEIRCRNCRRIFTNER